MPAFVSTRSITLTAVGTFLASRLPGAPDPGVVAVLGVAVLLACCWRPLRWLLPLMLGVGWCVAYVALAETRARAAVPEGERVQVTGRIADLRQLEDGARAVQRLYLDRVEMAGKQPWPGGYLLLTTYERLPVRVGDRWVLTVRLRRPRGVLNPDGFDLAGWAFAEGLIATGSVTDVGSARRVAATGRSLFARQRLRQVIAQRVEQGSGRALLLALVLGDRAAIAPDLAGVLRDTGTSHLFVVSGLHVGIVVGTVMAGMRIVGASLTFAACAGGIVAAGYAALVGFGLPVQRALASALLVLGALMLTRQLSTARLVALALLTVCAINPLATLGTSFWMSFGAVAVLLISWAGQQGAGHGLLEATPAWRAWNWMQLLVRVQLVLGTALVPLSLEWVGQWTPLGLPANLIAVPAVTLVVVPLALAASLLAIIFEPLAGLLFSVLAALLDLLAVVLGQLAGLHTPILAGPGAGSFWLTGTLGMLLATLPLPRAWRAVALALALPALMAKSVEPGPGELWIDVIDVGQGLAILLRTRSRALLYDAGPRYDSGFDAGRAVVAPYLARLGVRRLDAMVLSHADTDHAGGAEAVLRFLPVLARYGPGDCAPRSWRWDAVRLHQAAGKGQSTNDRSCILLVELDAAGARQTVLLPGDIEAGAETALVLAGWPGGAIRSLEADVLIVPHHGSTTSSTHGFLNQVQPRVAIVSSGYQNRFGHPHPAIVARLSRRGAVVLQTATSGAIRVRLAGSELITEPAYAGFARLWRPAPDCIRRPDPRFCRTVHRARP